MALARVHGSTAPLQNVQKWTDLDYVKRVLSLRTSRAGNAPGHSNKEDATQVMLDRGRRGVRRQAGSHSRMGLPTELTLLLSHHGPAPDFANISRALSTNADPSLANGRFRKREAYVPRDGCSKVAAGPVAVDR